MQLLRIASRQDLYLSWPVLWFLLQVENIRGVCCRYSLRTGVWGVHGGRDFMNLDETTFAQELNNAGYATAMYGKW